jgi:hypothetical protein
MGILLIAVGEVKIKVIETLEYDLNGALRKQVWIGKGVAYLDYAFNKKEISIYRQWY